MVSLFSFSPCAMISELRTFASATMSAMRFSAFARLCRPSSPAAIPSAICFWRVSIARMSGGQTNFAVNRMNAKNATACMRRVKLMFIAASGRGVPPVRLLHCKCAQQRIRDREPKREPDADDERRVDEAEQQEDLGLQLRHQLGLPGGAFEEARAHDAHADAGAERAE